ncbi:hypothetical protein J437_LFUL009821 [Ladona fulva]|uniref:Secreted protein n=1 Tax=Ladona fulva TaxID=123851 RepID=A0A8K0K7A7_LADFU|nr:hypothetical protein J437_LFUL009821 [Ladona fulva]
MARGGLIWFAIFLGANALVVNIPIECHCRLIAFMYRNSNNECELFDKCMYAQKGIVSIPSFQNSDPSSSSFRSRRTVTSNTCPTGKVFTPHGCRLAGPE